MLRRPATTLHITSEDVASYEDRRAREALVAAQQARRAAAVAAAQQSQADMEGVHQALQERERDDDVRRVREERIGVSRRRWVEGVVTSYAYDGFGIDNAAHGS